MFFYVYFNTNTEVFYLYAVIDWKTIHQKVAAAAAAAVVIEKQ